MWLLQRRFALGCSFGEFDFGDSDQNLGARLEVRCLEQCLLLDGPIGRHHREGVDQSFVGRFLDAFPIGLEVVRLE